MTDFEKKVYADVRKIPCGKVTTYAVVAHAIGRPRACRAVGNALNKNLFLGVPCHRVVRSDGEVGGFARGTKVKINLLRKEGIKIVNRKVDYRYITN